MSKAIDDWKIALDKDEIVGAVLIYIIDNNLLLRKLEAYCMEEGERSYSEDYLSRRKQGISLDGEVSEWSDVHKRVPQGSILGPILLISM